LACIAVAVRAAPSTAESSRYLEDFDVMARAVAESYAYFDGSRATWSRARAVWRPRAGAARSRAEFVRVLEGALAHLRDDHTGLSEHHAGSARAVPAESDLWAEWRDGTAVITAVRAFSEADIAGLHPGHVVTHLDGVPMETAVRERLRSIGASDAAARNWTLRHLLAGPRAGTLRVTVLGTGGGQVIEIERAPIAASNGPPLVARRMGEERDIGYIRIKNVLGDARLPAQFDGALNYLKDTRALILDLRETAGGGARAVAQSILARFVEKETPWQVREAPGRARVVDVARPGKEPPYRGRVVVLVDRWTAGEAEALAAGLQAARATLVGTPMAGLRGELREVKLPHSGIVVRFPSEKAFLVDGTPRESLKPSIEVDLAAPSGGPGDPILYQALKLLGRPSPGRAGRSARRSRRRVRACPRR
jgi:C-terminal processing protease CtpA/Prc